MGHLGTREMRPAAMVSQLSGAHGGSSLKAVQVWKRFLGWLALTFARMEIKAMWLEGGEFEWRTIDPSSGISMRGMDIGTGIWTLNDPNLLLTSPKEPCNGCVWSSSVHCSSDNTKIPNSLTWWVQVSARFQPHNSVCAAAPWIIMATLQVHSTCPGQGRCHVLQGAQAVPEDSAQATP